MKISAFTFLRNAAQYQFPFIQSIRSALPLVDEFIIALGPCHDDTEAQIRALQSPKIRIIPTAWNENLSGRGPIKGFIYGQQKSIALFNCTGDWALYLEGDEILHEDDLLRLRAAMERHLDNPSIEALYFRYYHFYGNAETLACAPQWYRREVRVVRNTIPVWGLKGLFFSIPVSYKRMRYPRAAFADAAIYHYGWVRPESLMNAKWQSTIHHWGRTHFPAVRYAEVDSSILRPFTGTHPAAIRDWLPESHGLFQANPAHVLTPRERKNRRLMWLEKHLHLDLSRRHFIQAD